MDVRDLGGWVGWVGVVIRCGVVWGVEMEMRSS